MTDQLRDVLTRVADRAGPVSVDPLLWSRASRIRRRRRGFTVAAAVSSWSPSWAGSSWQREFSALPRRPSTDRTRRIRSRSRGSQVTGGCASRRTWRSGGRPWRSSTTLVPSWSPRTTASSTGSPSPASTHPSTQTAAEQGVDLPEILSLSPDGTKLIYAWHEPFVPSR